ncbi:DUF1659 domain-containing protein [Alicyclobacillus fodiniaquatilis]|jgi:hypothetical protein|uniref:DUF1659 domain-containing protein n=1 Tax=Alicyclobacillus fodiniaquatilis TaxID=1661150 RepID=A0ABW4JCH7_9BACL
MAQTTPASRVLQIQLQSGTLANGEPKVQKQNFANVVTDAADDDLLAVGQAIAALFSEPLIQIARVDTTVITAASSGNQ